MGVPLRVLLVEDSEDDALLLMRELRRGGYEPRCERVDTAGDMEAALDERVWDLVIADHSMPAFSSSAALELLKRKGFVDTPFIIVSGRIGEDAAVAAMKAGAHDYIMKDNLARLNTAIERELREAEVRRERRRTEEALRVSETRFRLMIEQSPLSIQIFSPDGRTVRVNRAWERLWGVTLGQIPDYNVLEDVQLVEKGVMPYIEEGFAGRATAIPPVEYEPAQTIPDVSDVSRRWVRAFIYPVKGAGGNILEVVLVHEDITERMEAEEERRRAQEKYRVIFENAVEGIFQTTVEGRFVTANPALARMFGYDSPEELLENGSNIAEQLYVQPERRTEFGRLVQRDGFVRGFEVQAYRKSGSVMWASVSARAVRDAGGGIVGYEGTVEDITERKRTEEALRQSEELYRSVVEQAAENIFIVDVETKRILESNPAFYGSLGYSPEEIRRLTLYDIVAHDLEGIDRNIGRIVAEGHRFIGERRYRRKDGFLINVEVSASAISYDSREALCVVARDVTERKRTENALREIREAERRRIARELHDVVLQDLTYALQSLQVARRMPAAGTNRDEEMGRQVEALKRAVGGLRDAIYELRLQSAQEQPLVRTLESIVELNRQMDSGCAFELVVEEEFPALLSGAAGLEFARIVQEALANVRRHSGARRATVTLGTAGDEAWVEIEDDGRGFGPEEPPGMGFTGMRERAAALGGQLEVKGEEGVGTRVHLQVALPVLAGEDPEYSNAR
jgi:PAS domain S-box-containing protein